MKKLRMIVTSVVVLAIVGGAFAFKTKEASFCVLSGTTAGNCTAIKTNFKISTDAGFDDYRYYTNWNGTPSLCTQDAGAHCTFQIKLTKDQ